MASIFHYFVEGECEKTFIRSYMFRDGKQFKPGKIEVFNFVNERLSKPKARTINKDMYVVIVFDTDVEKIEVLQENIKLLKTVSLLDDSHIILIPSVRNFEEELVRSCSKLKTIDDLFKTKSTAEFKKKFISHSDIVSKLDSVGFDFDLIWTRECKSPFGIYKNGSKRIKQLKEY